jgi:hypothetical protein
MELASVGRHGGLSSGAAKAALSSSSTRNVKVLSAIQGSLDVFAARYTVRPPVR